jgi:hypothetical protein
VFARPAQPTRKPRTDSSTITAVPYSLPRPDAPVCAHEKLRHVRQTWRGRAGDESTGWIAYT